MICGWLQMKAGSMHVSSKYSPTSLSRRRATVCGGEHSSPLSLTCSRTQGAKNATPPNYGRKKEEKSCFARLSPCHLPGSQEGSLLMSHSTAVAHSNTFQSVATKTACHLPSNRISSLFFSTSIHGLIPSQLPRASYFGGPQVSGAPA